MREVAKLQDADLVEAPVSAPAVASESDMSRLYFAVESARRSDAALIVQLLGVSGGEGVSTVAAGFAARSAREPNSSILIVSCAKPAGREPPRHPFLIDLFRAGQPPRGVRAPADRAYAALSAGPGGERIRCAMLGRDPELEMDPRMLAPFRDWLRRSFTLIVLDCEPVAGSPVSGLLSRVADGTILVAEAGRTKRDGLARTAAEIGRAGGQVVGAVLNRQRDWLPRWLRRRMG